MPTWPNAGWSDFLSDRYFLYQICEMCHTFPGAGTPTQYLGFGRYFSDRVCAEIDIGLAQFRGWYTSRMEQRRKVGKHKWEPTYKNLDEVLGVTEALRRGGWDGKELTDVSQDYRQAVIAATKKGLPPPDITVWMANRDAGASEESPDE